MKKRFLLYALLGLAAVPLARADVIADSITEWSISGTQGEKGWYAGYRNLTADGGAEDGYNVVADFILFPPSTWNGSGYDLEPGAPWTELYMENSHPNGTNNGEEHWAIRRWVAQDLGGLTPVEVTYRVRKTNPNGGGVTAMLFQNGVLRDRVSIEGGDSAGVERVYYLNVLPGDVIDLALTPENADGSRDDGSDGSAFSMTIDDAIPANPRQPDGTPFVPASLADTDGDGLPDIWEERYFPGDLTQLSGAGDKDGDGLTDAQEYARGTDPTLADTDGDGLVDGVETGTGIFVSVNDTGTDPLKADTDEDGIPDAQEVNSTPRTDPNKADTDDDGFSDSEELAFYSDPLNGEDTPLTYVVANSQAEFSGVQGQDDWEYGYRNFRESGATVNYDPEAAFIKFQGGSDVDEPWSDDVEGPQHWRGSYWDLHENAPWTTIGATDVHPNGFNNGEEHWTIRRWRAKKLTAPTAVSLTWRLWKTNPNEDGVTGALYVNGKLIDRHTIPGSNTSGVVRRMYTILNPGDIVDLALTPEGVNNSGDGWDGSGQWLRVDTRIPANAVSSNGAPFFPPGSPDTDGDGLPDGWEFFYQDGGTNLALFSGDGDNDGDGLTNIQEMARGTNPLLADTDGDGLSDLVETKSGVVNMPTDSGSDPLRADSDGDGLSDYAEVMNVQFPSDPMLRDSDADTFYDRVEAQAAVDPRDPERVPSDGTIADSIAGFSGIQGENGWEYGFRDVINGEAGNYDPEVDFIRFEGGADFPDEWDGGAQTWDSNTNNWRLSDAAPWTNISQIYVHPYRGGSAESPVIHWAIRRWNADVTAPTPLALRWHTGKSNINCGDGVTGALYINGVLKDEMVVGFNDGYGVSHVYYAVINPGDRVDLVVKHNGVDNSDNDYCDGSNSWLRVDDFIPANAVQPDGSPFPPAEPGETTAFEVSSVARDAATGAVTLTWTGESGKVYDVYSSETLGGGWTRLTPEAGLAGVAGPMTYTDNTATPAKARVFYRVTRR